MQIAGAASTGEAMPSSRHWRPGAASHHLRQTRALHATRCFAVVCPPLRTHP